MKTNRRMEALLDEICDGNLDAPKALPQKLEALLNGGFVEEDQCVFFHTVRSEETWFAKDLEGFREEAVAELETQESAL